MYTSSSSGSTSQRVDNDLLRHVSPEELREQQRLLDRFQREKEKRELERIKDNDPSVLQPVAPPSQMRSQPQSLTGVTTPRLSRSLTVSSTGATVGDAEDEPLPPRRPSVPFMPSSFRRKHTRQDAQSATSCRPVMCAQTGHTRLQAGVALLNTGRAPPPSSSEASPPGPCSYSFPELPNPVPQALLRDSESSPPGYEYAISAYPRHQDIRPLRLLSLDGGGVRGISSLRVLKAIMDRVSPGARPYEYFDLIAGTSTGGELFHHPGYVARRLQMSVDDCIERYHHLAKQIFQRNMVAQLGSFVFRGNRFNPANLEQAIKDIVKQTSPENVKMADHQARCARAFVVAVQKSNVNNQSARRIRTYPTLSSPADTCEIWEAGRATSAAPSYFPPIKLKDEYGRSTMYIDGGLGYNNPSKELHNEARYVYGPDYPIGCFISIGTGHHKKVAFSHIRHLMSPAYGAFRAIVLSSEKAHNEMEQYFSRQPSVYFRFNARMEIADAKGDKDFIQSVALEDWQKMGQVEALTHEYLRLEETSKMLD
ncbi:hypothetical protein FRC06_006005, partial [Ceratobasidium sp. 370]